MSFHVCYYHLVWSTKHRTPIITPEIEQVVFGAIKRKSSELRSPIYAINGTSDHIHIATSIYTSYSVAEWVKGVKGVASYEVNSFFTELDPRFRWQSGYSVHTFGAKVLPFVIEYIENQKTRHGDNDLEDYLEQCPPDSPD